MKLKHYLPLGLAAVPLSALAAPQSLDNWQAQRPGETDTWMLSQLIGDDVMAGKNTEVGEVADVILDANGNIESLAVYSNGNQASRGYRQIDWPVKLFEPGDPQLSIARQPDAFAEQSANDAASALVDENQYLASKLLGMGVDVGGSPYAEVQSLIVDTEGQVSSIVIDPDGLDTVDYWIPTDFGWINPEWSLVVPYSQSDIEDAGSYEDGNAR